jgi:UDP:flavonoid glycosyltransferase YjiC (YdhE family)
MRFRPLPPAADFDDDDLDGWLPGRGRGGRLAAGRHDVLGLFLAPLPAQHAALSAERRRGYDAVLGDAAYLGVLPTLLTVPAAERMPIFGVSATPLSLTSVDTAPFGSAMRPARSAAMRLRNRHMNHVLRTGPLQPIQRAMNSVLAPFGVPAGSADYFDHTRYFDTCWQLGPREFEYPRRELPASFGFLGPLPPEEPPGLPLPPWWEDLDDGRPVVHVTQGTVDNHDLGSLLAATFAALADDDVWVVGSTGGRHVGELLDRLGGALPANGRVAPFLPYGRLLPRTAAMVTNGGYGGVTQALRAGVPLVVAGATEEKPEVAARVAWSGTGINLRSGRPAPRQLRAAVHAVLSPGSRYRIEALRMRQRIVELPDPVVTIARAIEAATASRRPAHPVAEPSLSA